MLSYSVGYSVAKGHDSGSGVMASELVGVPGLEPGTSSLSGKRSNRLSYTPGGSVARGLRLAATTGLLYRIPGATRTALSGLGPPACD